MKHQIRIGVFETNSSSSHSLQLCTSINDARNFVADSIRRSYGGDRYDNTGFDEKDYIYDGKVHLRGLELEDGDEMGNVYYIVNNWMAKIQLIMMKAYDAYDQKPIPEEFKKYIIDQAHAHGYDTVNDIEIEMEHHCWTDDGEWEMTSSTFMNEVRKAMIDENCMVFSDEAYSPWESPKTYII